MTQKIVKAAARIALGSREKLEMGNIGIQRDWGWAPEYVEAMWKMLQLESPEDFVIATGKTVSLEYFVERAFQFFGLDCRNHLVVNTNLLRPTDIHVGAADPTKAAQLLAWQPQVSVDGVIERMCIAANDKIKEQV